MMDSFREYTNWSRWELIFVDNGSAKATRDYLADLDECSTIVRYSHNVGFPAGVNGGIEEAQGDHIGILNNDILFSHNWLTKMVKVLMENEEVGIVSPLRVGMGKGRPQILGWQFDGLMGDVPSTEFTGEINMNKLRQGIDGFVAKMEELYPNAMCWNHDMVPFFCTLVRRQVFDDVGMLDEDFGIGMVEDTYFCRLAKLKGWQLVSCLDNYVHHFCSQTLKRVIGDNEAQQELQKRNYKLMHKKLAEVK